MSSILIGGILGGLIGLIFVNVMAVIAKNSDKHYDIIEFTSQESIWTKVDHWAQRHAYVLKKDEGGARRYQKGKNFLTSPMILDASQQGDQVCLKAYTRINGFIVQGDMPLSGGGFMAKLPRSMGKKAVNELLRELGQREIG
ncbi:MAG: hypothetical protein LBE62_14140 [Azonexus sp.]|jgi:hypothetical protein|nr:hypothetical protein [Azonexus sp.]